MTARYGCHDRAPFVNSYRAQDGYYINLYTPRIVQQPTFGKETCQYTLSEIGQTDPRCDGCKHKS